MLYHVPRIRVKRCLHGICMDKNYSHTKIIQSGFQIMSFILNCVIYFGGHKCKQTKFCVDTIEQVVLFKNDRSSHL
jgi:hypothetical protein